MNKPYSFILLFFLMAISCKNAPNTEGSKMSNTPVETPIGNVKTSKIITFQVVDAPNKTFG